MMEIGRNASGDLELREIDVSLAGLLLSVPDATDPGDSDPALSRLFPDPAPQADADLAENWEEFVRPDLRHLFEQAVDTVRRDLAAMKSPTARAGGHLKIPAPHFDAWLNTLNQARLALFARHGFTEADMERPLPAAVSSPADLALIQIHLYGLIQEFLIRASD
jgi:hypothetical protein